MITIMPRNRSTALAVLVAACLLTLAGLGAQAPPPRHVVMISIDGLKPSTYTQAGPSKVPTLRRLAREGAYADGVVGVEPTVTYPSHTTMITGVPPAVHGIYNNRIFDPEGRSNGAWYWYSRDIRVPTLPGVVKALGGSTAAISWPVTVDADIDYLVPEYPSLMTHPKGLDLLRALSHPRHLLDTFEANGASISWPMTDRDRVEVAAWILQTYRPHLMLLHIFETDDTEHEFGPDTPEALATIEEADTNVKRIVDAVTAGGLRDRTDIVIVSDHGFLPVARQLQLNFAFKQAGLLEVDKSDRVVHWDAYFYGAGGSGFVILNKPGDPALRDRVAGILKDIAANPANGILTVWNEGDLHRMGAEPRASFGIDMKDGFYTGGGHDSLMKQAAAMGGHGYAPDRPPLHASLIMAGPDVGTPGSLGIVRMTRIGPTVASWFGLALSPRADAPLVLPAPGSSPDAGLTPTVGR
jgi:hypothetical protein